MKSSLRYLGAVREGSRYNSPNSAYLNSLSCEKQIGLLMFLFGIASPKEPKQGQLYGIFPDNVKVLGSVDEP
jgi:hypothetical protein